VLLVSHDRALLDAVAHRLLAIEERAVNSYDGGWAEYTQRRETEAEAAPEPARPRKERPKPQRAKTPHPSELERLESEISRQEETVAELERRLSEDWSDVSVLAAHRNARDELQGLISRWERLFEEAQA
jgi:ATPase subunit of ABC transporter with duplicated ATPase domains